MATSLLTTTGLQRGLPRTTSFLGSTETTAPSWRIAKTKCRSAVHSTKTQEKNITENVQPIPKQPWSHSTQNKPYRQAGSSSFLYTYPHSILSSRSLRGIFLSDHKKSAPQHQQHNLRKQNPTTWFTDKIWTINSYKSFHSLWGFCWDDILLLDFNFSGAFVVAGDTDVVGNQFLGKTVGGVLVALCGAVVLWKHFKGLRGTDLMHFVLFSKVDVNWPASSFVFSTQKTQNILVWPEMAMDSWRL